MNLIQIQENLKDLPTPVIMAYANGRNPQVPPYMALGEMNRRKSMEQRAAQAPSSSVKEKLENELTQQVAMPNSQQGMSPQGMQPQSMPPQSMPPQQMAQAGGIPSAMPSAAKGGLTQLPIRQDVRSYAPGGIVAFSQGSNGETVYEESQTPSSPAPAELNQLPVGLANRILADRLEGKTDLPEPVSRDAIRDEVLAQKPELAGIINKLPGEALTKLAAQLEQQNLTQRERFKEGEGRLGLAALSQALIAAGEATRGQKGMGGIGAALGGFGKSYNAATAAQEERAAKQQALERAQSIETMKLQADIEQMQRAFAEGRVDEAMKLKDQINARKAKIEEIKGVAAKDTLSQYTTQQQREEQKRHNEASERLTQQQRDEQTRHNQASERYQKLQADIAAERARYERENRPSKEDKTVLSVMARLNADPQYKSLLKRQENFGPTDPEFEAIQDALDSIRDAAFADAKLAPPTKRDRLAPIMPVAEPSFFKRLTMTSADRDALDWANANPKDPRSAEIKKGLGF